MYQALYRKYRPKTLDEVAGQKVITQTIANEILHDKLSHAYLFAGPRGTGKTSIAKIIAKIINCDSPNGLTPCDVCVNCTQYNNKQATDIIEIDAASNNGVDEIRELKSKVSLVPTTGRYKIYIIDEVHMLTVGAFNALLKTLEEPPSHIIFILATTDPHKIPNTILSRCQRFDFEKISEDNIVDRLKQIVALENIKINDDALHEIARLSDGGMRDSLSMLDQVISFVSDDKKIDVSDVHAINGTLSQGELKDFITYFINHDLENLFKLIDEYNSSGKNIIKLTEEIILFLRNLLLYNEVPKYFKEKNYNIDVYEELSKNINSQEIINYIYELNNSLHDMKTFSSPKMILELVVIKLCSKKKQKVIETHNFKSQVNQIDKPIVEKIEPKIENKPVNNVAVEVEKKETIEIPNKDIKEKLKIVKQVRIENDLANLDKKVIKYVLSKEIEIRTQILNPDYNQVASMVLDGALKAAGNDYLIYVYNDEITSDLFNENIINIENMFEQIFNKKFKLISTYQDDWDEIKNLFNNKLKTFSFHEENYNLNNLLGSEKKESDRMTDLFGDIVEYE